ncbi:putative dioxygenase [Desulforapulum autotrophicum HRM2]|uniref:Dioxygenase n=1 Tax=Desulforapulum autotrophicum (strain ATCC 43914 / DSM 3382 / VKM B-1955 / HRM2) TaxID=177437 RepID=C0QM81_DESAH|nr:PfaD family polyunsaturated fatty acid/polyketide biosynthesis protein [Desulforapulum autotrophicum]ACN16398.1 putative dioxygenase [Desulforapulum autotrophicum HRM2]
MTIKKNMHQGFWQPANTLPEKGVDSIKQSLMRLSHPVYLVDLEQETAAANTGSALVGRDLKDETTPYPLRAYAPALPLENLGDAGFKARHGIRYPYVAGAMANGITSVEMVAAMAENGMIGFFGAGGLSVEQVEAALVALKQRIGDRPFGSNLIHSPGDPELEMSVVNLYLRLGVTRVSAAAFMRITPALAYYRIKGIHRDENGTIVTPNLVIAKVSRIEVARQFFSPPPEKLVADLLNRGLITDQEAKLSQSIPMAQDLTAEADSGGHTDNRPALALLPIMLALRDEFNEGFTYDSPLCVGLAGGIATPAATAAAFHMGAAYVLSGSINQSCIEAATSDGVKQLLARTEQADVAMAPAADMFELGARVQVLKRGTMFPLRAEKLYRLYKTYDAFEAIPLAQQREIETKFLLASFEETWQQTRTFFLTRNIKEVVRAENDPKHKMSLVFRSYLGQSSRWATTGEMNRLMDFQIWCGPAMGAFNQWVKGSFLEPPENRRVVDVALNLLVGAAVLTRAGWLRNQGASLDSKIEKFTPIPREQLLEMISM